MSGAIARLGSDVLQLCPEMKDRDDEGEIQKHVCFVLGEEVSVLQRIKVLEPSEIVIQFLTSRVLCLPAGAYHKTESQPLRKRGQLRATAGTPSVSTRM